MEEYSDLETEVVMRERTSYSEDLGMRGKINGHLLKVKRERALGAEIHIFWRHIVVKDEREKWTSLVVETNTASRN